LGNSEAFVGATSITMFDANAYRGLVHRYPASAQSRAALLVAAERAHGIRALANPFVGVELCSHLADHKDRGFTECVAAICAMWTHCNNDVHGYPQLATLVDTEGQLCKGLYGRVPDGHEAATNLMAELVRDVQSDPHPAALTLHQQTFEQVKRIADKFENDFVASMNSSLHGFDLSDPEQRRTLGQTLKTEGALIIAGVQAVLRVRTLLGLQGDDPELAQRAEFVVANCPTAVRLYVYKLRQIAVDGMDIAAPRQRNSVWDIDLSFLIGNPVCGLPIHLVTTDSEIVDIAKTAGQSGHVETLDHYLRRLGVIK
jgi:hypothetical protein